jgi:hypothetical protein
MPTRDHLIDNFDRIRTWEGSQDKAFEQLCFQLRDPEPPGVKLRKTADPDGGFEWYWLFRDGHEEGWQAKFSFDEKTLISGMKASFTSVAKRRGKKATRITFCIPRDFADDPDGARGKFGWQRYDDAVKGWAKEAPWIEVHLIQGGQLLERLAENEHRGRQWFWFGQPESLDLGWCRRQRQLAIDEADDRYHPEFNVDLQVGKLLAAPAQPPELRARFEDLVKDLLQQVIRAGEFISGGEFEQALAEVEKTAAALERLAALRWEPNKPLNTDFDQAAEGLQQGAAALSEQIYAALDEVEREQRTLRAQLRAKDEAEQAQDTGDEPSRSAADAASEPEVDPRDRQALELRMAHLDQRAQSFHAASRYADRLWSACRTLTSFLGGKAIAAARSGGVFLDGAGGSGKTHLCCQVAGESLDQGQPALVLLGQWFGRESPWRTLAERLGEPGLSPDEIVGAMEAAAQASDRRLLLVIDAINDASDAGIWADHINELYNRLTGSDWVALAVTCRSTYLRAVTPPGGLSKKLVPVTHPGFQGREFEAAERIFSAFDVAQPAVPLLFPEFTNPLFLVMYADSLSRGKLTGGATHLTAVFDAFVEARKPAIERKLGLDPALDPVGKALTNLAQTLAERGEEHLGYQEAKEAVDKHAPGLHQFPNTLFGQLQSEGLLSRDMAYLGGGEYGEAVRFPYQRFSDHLIVEAALAQHFDPEHPEGSFASDQPLGQLLGDGPAGLVAALAIQLPERWGMELPDVTDPELIEEGARWRVRTLAEAFVDSVAVRASDAVTDRTAGLLDWAADLGLGDEVLRALIAAAPIPNHPLNSEWLTGWLLGKSMPERDALWGIMTYWAHAETTHPLDRLARWAAAGPYSGYPDRVVELAAQPLVWMLASPNRFGRDNATKALIALLHHDLPLVTRILGRFAEVDDVYVTERLAAVAYGCLLRSDPRAVDPAQAEQLLEAMVASLDRPLPNLLARDHVAGAARYCQSLLGVARQDLIEAALPPYGAKPPKRPRTKEHLQERYPAFIGENEVAYGSIDSSVFGFVADFANYVMRRPVESFRLGRLGEVDLEALDDPGPVMKIDRRKWRRFVESLDAEQLARLDQNRDLDRLSMLDDGLSLDQARLMNQAIRYEHQTPKPLREYPNDHARRFVFQRAVELGWAPERFAEHDRLVGRSDRGRDSSKPERFGKKYQRIALCELLARLADNHVFTEWNGEPVPYEGAWQLDQRDIDPSLQPSPVEVSGYDDQKVRPPFKPEAPRSWWVPPEPRMELDTDQGAWSLRSDDLPEVASLFERTDPDGVDWIVLGCRHEWKLDPEEDGLLEEHRSDQPRRDLHIALEAAFAERTDLARLNDWFGTQPDVYRAIPGWDRQSSGEPYLGELWWHPASDEAASEWATETHRRKEPELPVPVIPAVVPWHWGTGVDCSVPGPINLHVPSSFIAALGGLVRPGPALEWYSGDSLVLRFVETDEGWDRDWALLARRDWLAPLLEEAELVLVAGVYSERRVFQSERFASGDRLLGWVDRGAGAILDCGDWAYRGWDELWDRRSGTDPV